MGSLLAAPDPEGRLAVAVRALSPQGPAVATSDRAGQRGQWLRWGGLLPLIASLSRRQPWSCQHCGPWSRDNCGEGVDPQNALLGICVTSQAPLRAAPLKSSAQHSSHGPLDPWMGPSCPHANMAPGASGPATLSLQLQPPKGGAQAA